MTIISMDIVRKISAWWQILNLGLHWSKGIDGLLCGPAILVKPSKNTLGHHLWDILLALENTEFAPVKVSNSGRRRDDIIEQEGMLGIIQTVVITAILHRMIGCWWLAWWIESKLMKVSHHGDKFLVYAYTSLHQLSLSVQATDYASALPSAVHWCWHQTPCLLCHHLPHSKRSQIAYHWGGKQAS